MAVVIGQNARRIRLGTNTTMEALAAEARQSGLKWSTARVVDLERGKLSPTLPMLVAFGFALGRATGGPVSLADLLGSDGPIEVNDRLTLSSADLQGVLRGEPVQWNRTMRGVSDAVKQYADDLTIGDALVWDSYGLGDERAAKKLGLSKSEMVRRSGRLWGHNLSAERDKRSGDDANAQKRGQVTRVLLDELRSAGDGDH